MGAGRKPARWERMHLVEILLPLRDPDGQPFGRAPFSRIKEEMTERFGGVTAFTRSPAEGLWESGDGRESDEIVVLQVMDESLDRGWWGEYRRQLEGRFRQDEIIVRASEVDRL